MNQTDLEKLFEEKCDEKYLMRKDTFVKVVTELLEQNGARWVKVEERLPEAHKAVLICNSKKYDPDMVCVAFYTGEQNIFMISEIEMFTNEVTDWMEIPPPKAEK